MSVARWHGVLAGAGLVGLAAAAALSAPAAGAAGLRGAPAAATLACRKAQGPFRVRGTRVIGKGGKAFIPYGITVPGLFHPRGYDAQRRRRDDMKIKAAADSWCGNTVRLQISQNELVGPGALKGFLGDIEHEVQTAESLRLVVVLNDQTETDPGNSPGPTQATLTFWRKLATRYHGDPQVIFDLFNEPRIKTGKVCGSTADWRAWQRGTGSFVGMRGLVKDVLADEGSRPQNLLWVEGPCFAGTLARVTSFPVISSPLAVYVFHHPTGGHNARQWDSDFGYLVNRDIAPVVDGEWTNYTPPQLNMPKSECWQDAPTAVPAYLSYLGRHGIGMTGYELAKGLLIESDNLADPTKIRADWTCSASPDKINNPLDEGAGSLIMNWYKRRNAAYPRRRETRG